MVNLTNLNGFFLLFAKYFFIDCLENEIFDHNLSQSPLNLNTLTFLLTPQRLCQTSHKIIY